MTRTLCALGFLCVLVAPAFAQFQMPDPKQMAGIPRPVNDLPDGTVSVRLIRGQLSNNITNFPVELHIGAQIRTVKTDDAGRAEFGNLPAGEKLKAVAVVDGERLESEEFPAPANGGIRLMLVATDTAKGATAPAPAVSGNVVIGGQSRIIVAPGDETVSIYYLLDVVNNGREPVNPPNGFAFDMPTGAVGTTLLEGTTPAASVKGGHVNVQGPFAPGRTLVQVACNLPATTASIDVTQRFPANMETVSVFVRKLGELRLTSPQLASQQDMPVSGETFIAASGGPISAGQPIVLTLDGLPHHSGVPRVIALTLAGGIVVLGVWLASRSVSSEARVNERKRLLVRRDKLFNELVRLERDRRGGKVAEARYASRREEIVSALEHLYGVLDSDQMDPEPAEGSGVAA